ncbi:DNA modification methylase [Halarchaeum solikamskense]|uniref:DNA-methyltransferase n=1 Tax=Halarchaeum nitratireducens TaxID=489913 RepID=UPI001B3AFF08|nr:site-specific DNA-methyltransferase [Halarchaeum solikamskense]MBP2252318.1 DNA modification methylase [Halarchaeum solikamskense]
MDSMPGYDVHFTSSEEMSELAEESVQTIVTSPPYYQEKNYGSHETNLENRESYEEYKEGLKSVLEECFRVLKPDGKLCLNLMDPYTTVDNHDRFQRLPLTQEMTLFLEELGIDYMETVRWCKKRFGNSGTVFGSYPHPTNLYFAGSYENLLIFRKWVSEEYYSKRELPDKEVKEASKVTKEEWREWTDPTWQFDGVDTNDDHPAKFPYELPYRCIRMFSFEGDTVLDPFCGSGTALKAAVDTGRKAVGYEVEEKYKDTIEEKLSQTTLPQHQ